MNNSQKADAVCQLVEFVRPLFAGQSPEVQGGALADLLSIFLAGHQGEAKDEMRKEQMALIVETAWKLVPVNESIMLERENRRSD